MRQVKKLLSNSIAKTFWSNTFFVIALTAIAVQLIVPSFSLSKYVLDPVQYNFSLTSSESFGINLKAIGPIIGTTVPGETLTAGTLWPLGATASY